MRPLLDVHRFGWLAVALIVIPAIFNPPPVQADDTAGILFVSSRTSAPYLRFIERAKQEFNTGSPVSIETTSLSVEELTGKYTTPAENPPDMVVALGKVAAKSLLKLKWQSEVPVLYTLIPKSTYDSLRKSGSLACPGNQCTAIYIDQPLQRLFHVLDTAFAGRRRLGVLLGPASVQQEDTLAGIAGKTGFSLFTAEVNKQGDLLPALNSILKQSDLLLSIPDPVVYNRRTAKSVLLTTYRYKVPVLAYSKAYADAGATLSVYSTPEQIARQAAGIIKAFIGTGKHSLPAPEYPQHYKIRINQHVADSLGLDLENNPELQLLKKEADDE